MSEKEYLDDISQIKDLMNRSSRFLSLSGLSGILAGIYALIGAALVFRYVFPPHDNYINLSSWNFQLMLIILASVVVASVGTAYLLTQKKAKKNNEKVWDATALRLLVNFLIPLVVGGIYILIKLQSQHYGLTASLMLIFYGLALVNASKYTVGNVRYLGYAQLIIGLCCAAYPGYGFWLWVLGFGVFHIIYGALMYLQDKR